MAVGFYSFSLILMVIVRVSSHWQLADNIGSSVVVLNSGFLSWSDFVKVSLGHIYGLTRGGLLPRRVWISEDVLIKMGIEVMVGLFPFFHPCCRGPKPLKKVDVKEWRIDNFLSADFALEQNWTMKEPVL